MKKVLVVVLALVMAFAFTACGGSDKDSGDKVKVGCIFIGSINDGGFTQCMNEGLEKAAKENGVELIKKENVSDSDTQASKDAATNLIDQGCTIIVGCSYGYGDALNELANSGDYDDVTFLHFSGPYQNETNMENFFGSMEEARYLSGMAAASVTKSNKLGYVAAHPYTEVQIGIDAFTLGAQAVNPDVEVKVVYINTWGDAEIEKAAAEQLISAGCGRLYNWLELQQQCSWRLLYHSTLLGYVRILHTDIQGDPGWKLQADRRQTVQHLRLHEERNDPDRRFRQCSSGKTDRQDQQDQG